MLSNAAFLEGLRKERYDIGMAEAIDATAHEVFRVLGIKTAFATSATALSSTTTWPLGLPQPPSFIPGIYVRFFELRWGRTIGLGFATLRIFWLCYPILLIRNCFHF